MLVDMSYYEKNKMCKSFTEAVTRMDRYKAVTGPGLLRKWQRFRLIGILYLEYVLSRVIISKYRRQHTFFWGETVYMPMQSNPSVLFFGVWSSNEIELTRFCLEFLNEGDVFLRRRS